MRTTITLIVGILVALAGTIFILQGLGVIVSSSSMTNDRSWVVIGAVMVVAGIGLSWWGWSRRSRPGSPEPPAPPA
ncbi:MAG TPA: hypothetical protein VIC63_02615 [Candidatus Limnocylindria bacterium]